MKIIYSIYPVLVVVFCFFNVSGQVKTDEKEKILPYIEVSGCRNCSDIVVSLADPAYPSVGYGAHVYNGTIAIRISIDKNGNVVNAKAVGGHSFFRQLLEKEALKAKFKAEPVESHNYRSGIIFYKIVSTNDKTSENTQLRLAVINGMATSLPKPEHSQDLKDLCADGHVEVEVTVDVAGRVVKSKAITGDELLWPASIRAANNARFSQGSNRPPILKGKIIYNFVGEEKCFDAGVVNAKIAKAPMPQFSGKWNKKEEVEIKVRIVIDQSGDVVAAKSMSANPSIRLATEKAAKATEFPPTLINADKPIRVKAIIVYKIQTDGSVKL